MKEEISKSLLTIIECEPLGPMHYLMYAKVSLGYSRSLD